VANVDTKPSLRIPFGRCMVAILKMLIKDINWVPPRVQIMEMQGRRRVGEFFQWWYGSAVATPTITVDIDDDGMAHGKGPKGFIDDLGPVCLGVEQLVMKPMHHSMMPFMWCAPVPAAVCVIDLVGLRPQ